MKRITSVISIILIAGIMFSGCKKSTDTPPVTAKASVPNSFIWNTMHDNYLWTADVPALSNPSYATAANLDAYLNTFSDPSVLFKSLVYFLPDSIDKWSFIEDNSKNISDWIAGISETNGYAMLPVGYGTSKSVFGLVLYVFKGSPAEKAGVKRGDIFVKVNDQLVNESNYLSLLYNTLTSKLSYATIVNRTIIPDSRTVTITAVNMQENPIFMDTVFTFNNQKIGYLVYNGFNSEFDLKLNDVIQKFKDANIGQMVLDLRYNGGGSVQTSSYLASMIYGTDNTQLFAKAQYNQAVQAAIMKQNAQYLNLNFTNTILSTSTTQPATINTLNLKKIYIIVSDNTASASELLINGLRPYVTVKMVGINTVGKYVGSVTLTDTANPSDTWAMQPIVVKFANSVGYTDFVHGLTPDIVAFEDFAGLLPFGDPNEPLLKAVLNDMQGGAVTSQTLKSTQMGLRKITTSRTFKPHAKDMYINPDIFKGLKIKHITK